ncbi:hypothetical protein CLAFUW4_06878 [Fulvia fulva]|nr:hypothetical protein CLAFUR4_06886 [Fulvia fulva]WPV16328.1 hypothetical protein CLAFUW4_06878 [Fulvia fulva]WPV31548.1 hypothetical protein CLAFUW7_06877 [Fulvia fulva]
MEGNGESHREGHDSFYGRMLIEEWEPLFQYQQQTPASYDDARPRIHAIASGATVKLVPKQWRWESVFQHLTIQNFSDDGEDDSAEAAAPPPNPDDTLIHCHPIDIWVTSSELYLYREPARGGVKCSYRSMPIVGVQGADLYIQLNLSDDDTPDDEIEFMELRITADEVDSYDQSDIATGGTLNEDGSIKLTTNVADVLCRAISACHDLHPDPPSPGEEDVDMEEDTRPGAGGWITSENLAEYTDENGNFRMPEGITVINGDEEYEEQEPLGPGAGTTRTAAEAVEAGTLEEADRPGPPGSGPSGSGT